MRLSDFIRDGSPLTAWHYTLQYWGKRMQYHIKNDTGRKVLMTFLMLFSPLAYYRKINHSAI